MKRKPKPIPEYLTPEEIERLFASIQSPRDRALFKLAYHRGLRASELGKLDIGDYRPQANRLFVRRLKGSRSGEYHLTEDERTALRSWMRVRGNSPGPLFRSRNHKPISRYQIFRLMKRYCAAAGIAPEKAHPHALKHSCGTHLSAMEPDVAAIQDHLGHVNIQNTMIYVAISNRRRDEFGEKLASKGFGRAKRAPAPKAA